MAERITRERELEVIDIRRSREEGRILVGRALRYNQRDLVSDDGRNTYYETWRPGVFARSIELKGTRIPLVGRHDYTRWPFGAVRTWQDTPDALGFEAKVSNTVAGDEILELINDGAVTGISVGAEPIENRQAPDGTVERMVAKLMELSICTFGQLDGAEILAVRAQDSPAMTPRLDQAQQWLKDRAALTSET